MSKRVLEIQTILKRFLSCYQIAMNQKHFVLACIFIDNWDHVGNDWYKNHFLSLIFQREWQEGIVDSINHLAEKIDNELEDAELYDECKKQFEMYINRDTDCVA